MGPPLHTWPYSHTTVDQLSAVNSDSKRCAVTQLIGNFRVMCLNFTFAVVFFQIMMGLSSVGAGPVVLNMDYMQGPVPLARNIRHLPCISRRTSQEGMCMFAIDCLKANGTHLGTCIDRFYFGSCCQILDKTILPQIISNHIDDNSIDNANFVHPQTEDKIQNKIPSIFPTRKPTTQKVETTTRESTERTESLELETKSDEQTTIDNRIINDEVKLTTVVSIETTTKLPEKAERPITEMPIKLSTFQTVSGDASTLSSTETTPKVSETTVSTTTTTITTTTKKQKKPTRRPVRPFTRPSYKPANSTRPLYTSSTLKPKPPISLYNTTRKPPYKQPPRRTTTKKPFPIPPRLNITILPQSTSSKPLLTRPSSVSITYINTTQVATTKEEPKITTTTTTTTTSTTTPMPITTTTPLTTTTTTTTTTTEKDITTETIPETTVLTTEAPTEKTETITTESAIETVSTEAGKVTTIEYVEKETTIQDVGKEPTNQDVEKGTTNQDMEKGTTNQDEEKETTVQEVVTEEAVKPVTEAVIPSTVTEATTSSTEYPPLVTWGNTVDAATKAPEKVTESSDEIWSPITPPEGWILLSTIKPEISSTTTTTTTTTSEAPTTQPATEAPQQQETTSQIIETTEKAVEIPTETVVSEQPILTTSTTVTTTESTTTTEAPTTQSSSTSTTTEAPTTKSSTTEASTQAPIEFTVNVTLSPTVPTTTPSVGLTTFTSVTTFENATKANVTESSSATTVTEPSTSTTTTEFSLESLGSDKNDYKKVCGRRLWQAPTGRIVGGDQSGFGMWPWQISLRQYRTSTYLHKCGAALLNENWAITAAHCVEHVPPSELLVRLGEHDLANEDEPYGFAERRVQIVASHPHFDPATFEYDLALLRFYEPVKFQPNILPICVPDTDEDFVGKTAFVTGWGRLYDEGPLPSVLQEVKVPVINNSACEAMYQAAGYNEHIPNIFICAGRSKGGTDSCEGDSGGPMVVPRERDGRFVLGGIISWGIGCAEPNQPGVYTRISEFRDWINQILQF